MNTVRARKTPKWPAVRGPLMAALFLAYAPVVMHQAIAQEGGRSGKEVVESSCVACHGEGRYGAPKIGDTEAWSKRASQGLTSLTKSALNGIRQMPAHGGAPELTDLEIGRAVTYMVNQSGGNWVEPASTDEMAATRSGEHIVKAHCSNCHRTGKGGAPKVGDKSAWIPRLNQGLDNLVQSAIRGHGGMPPRGGVANLTDSEIRGAIVYMFNPDAPAASRRGMPGDAQQTAAARSDPFHQTIGRLDVYLGITPAKTLLSFPADSPERSMHGGVPTGHDYQHINVTLLDRESSTPIGGAKIVVRVEEPGLTSESTTMEPMAIGTPSYGAYLRMKPNTNYLITVRVQPPDSPQTTEFRFKRER